MSDEVRPKHLAKAETVMLENPTSLITTIGLVKVAADVGTDALKRIQGPFFDLVGQQLRDKLVALNEVRAKRAATLVNEVEANLEGTGHSVSEIPGRILFPMLEAAS